MSGLLIAVLIEREQTKECDKENNLIVVNRETINEETRLESCMPHKFSGPQNNDVWSTIEIEYAFISIKHRWLVIYLDR